MILEWGIVLYKHDMDVLEGAMIGKILNNGLNNVISSSDSIGLLLLMRFVVIPLIWK